MSERSAFDPWATLARIRDGDSDFRNFRNFRTPGPENAISGDEACEERLAVAMIDGELSEEEARRVASAVVCQVCGSAIASPVTCWWGGDPVHRECGEHAWRVAIASATISERAA